MPSFISTNQDGSSETIRMVSRGGGDGLFSDGSSDESSDSDDSQSATTMGPQSQNRNGSYKTMKRAATKRKNRNSKANNKNKKTPNQ